MGREDQVSENLRFLLWQRGLERPRWVQEVATWAGCDRRRARKILEGSPLSQAERERIAEATHLDEQELQHASLVRGGELCFLSENLRALLPPGKGAKRQLARVLSVDPSTVSHWLAGRQSPHPAKLRRMALHFGLGEGTDLARDPLFLSLHPLTEPGMRELLHLQLDRLDSQTLWELLPALRRLLEEP